MLERAEHGFAGACFGVVLNNHAAGDGVEMDRMHRVQRGQAGAKHGGSARLVLERRRDEPQAPWDVMDQDGLNHSLDREKPPCAGARRSMTAAIGASLRLSCCSSS